MSNNKTKRLLETAEKLRWDVGSTFHEGVVESIYADAAHIADRAVDQKEKSSYFDLDRTIDRLVTSRLFGFPLRSPYAASKWAIIGMTKTLAIELGEFNIRVNAICPGSVSGLSLIHI